MTGPRCQTREQRRRRTVMVLWIFAALWIAGNWYEIRGVVQQNRLAARVVGGDFIAIADWWRMLSAVILLVAIGAALIIQCRCDAPWLRRNGTIGLVFAIPAALMLSFTALIGGPGSIGTVQVPGGPTYILAIEPVMTDTVYTLHEPAGPTRRFWREVASLDYSEDGRFIGGEHLVLSPDAHWLAVARAGVWTDCFRIDRAMIEACRVATAPSWTEDSYERDMRSRSSEIERLVRAKPPAADD